MPSTDDDTLRALAAPGAALEGAEEWIPSAPGLYAIHGGPQVWAALRLGKPPDLRPLYVGKAEDSLATRDLRTHFGDGRIGQSTVRRSFAALLRDSLTLRARPRDPAKPGYFANFGLAPGDDERLTAWMRENLRLAVWGWDGREPLEIIELRVLDRLVPPLNLRDVATPWRNQIKSARAVMAADARASADASREPG